MRQLSRDIFIIYVLYLYLLLTCICLHYALCFVFNINVSFLCYGSMDFRVYLFSFVRYDRSVEMRIDH